MSNRPTIEPPEWLVRQAVLEAFKHADPSRPPPGYNLFMSCCETLREGYTLSIDIYQSKP